MQLPPQARKPMQTTCKSDSQTMTWQFIQKTVRLLDNEAAMSNVSEPTLDLQGPNACNHMYTFHTVV